MKAMKLCLSAINKLDPIRNAYAVSTPTQKFISF